MKVNTETLKNFENSLKKGAKRKPRHFWEWHDNQIDALIWLCGKLSLDFPYGLYDVHPDTFAKYKLTNLQSYYGKKVANIVMAILKDEVWVETQFCGQIDYDDELKTKMVDAYLETDSIAKVSKIFDLPLSSVSYVLNNLGYDTKRTPKYSEEEINKWVELYEDTPNTHVVSDKTGVPQRTILTELSKLNVILEKSRQHVDYLGRKYGEKIKEHYLQDHLSVQEICLKLKLSKGYVLKYLAKHNLTRKNYETHNLRLSEEHKYFDNIDNSEKAYWLGFITADGHVHKNGLKINVNVIDIKLIEKIAKTLKVKNIPIRLRTRPNGKTSKMVDFQFSSRYMSKTLNSIGLINKKSHSKDMVKILDAVPYEYMKDFIRGVFDGDGSVGWINRGRKDVNEKRVVSITCNIFLLTEIQKFVVKELGVKKLGVYNLKQSKDSGMITWGSRGDVYKILNWLYGDTDLYVQRKYEKAIEMINELKEYFKKNNP